MTSKLTRDIIQSEIADFFAGVVEIHTELGGPNTVEEAQNQLTERVLGCVPAPETEREPIAWLNDAYLARGVVDGEAGSEDAGPGYIPVYREAGPHQAPVVPEEWAIADAVNFCKETGRQDAGAAMDAWNACRAAMLQAGTLTNEGTKQAWTGIPDIDNAINMLDRIDTLDSCDDDRIEAVKTVLRRLAGNSPANPGCWCRTCRPVVLNDMRFVVCPDCGNKRCPRANDHRNACTRSNEPGQEGSAYPDTKQSTGSDPATVPGKWIPLVSRNEQEVK